MKKSARTYFIPFAFTILIAFLFSSCAGGDFDAAALTRSKIILSTNFESPTGWVTSSGNNIQISIDSSALDTVATIQCRSGVKAKIANVPFTVCPTTVSPVADVTQNSGTYTTEVKAIAADATIDSTYIDYYVHPSLSNLAACPDLKTDTQYLTAAGVYLNQSNTFGNTTSLKAPFTQIKFWGSINYPLTLRKKFVMNDAKTLILLKRRFVSQANDCLISSDILSKRTRSFANMTAATIADINAEEINLQSSRADLNYGVGSGLVTLDPAVPGAGTTQSTGGSNWNLFLKRTNKAPGNGYSTIQNAAYSMKAQCAALVLNAKGNGICFETGSDRLYRTVGIKNQFGSNPNTNISRTASMAYRSRKTFSSKWRKNKETDFNTFKAISADHGNFVSPGNGTDYEFYLLED